MISYQQAKDKGIGITFNLKVEKKEEMEAESR